MPAHRSSRPESSRDGDWRTALQGLGLGAGLGSGSESTSAFDSGSSAGSRSGSRPATRPLALQFELRRRIHRRNGHWQGPRDEPARRATNVDRLGVRPVVKGSRDAWIKGNLTWQNIAYQASAAGIDPAQSRWFAQFALLKGSNPAVYQYGSEWITLDEFESPLLWALLDEASRLGIALVGSDVTPDVVVGAAASVDLDASVADGAGGAGDLVLEPTVAIDGDRWRASAASGARPIAGHGLFRYDLDRGRIELAPLADGELTPAQRSLLAAPEPIHVPAADVPAFLREHYHRLARTLEVTSRDGTFVPPPAPLATLVLDARFEPHDVLRLAWTWEYADGRVVAVERSAADSVADDPELDDDLLARVVDELGWVPLDAIVLRGVDTAEFAAERMPRLELLAEHGGLRIDVAGERPDYRELVEPPQVRVTTVESRRTDWFDLGVMVTVAGKTVPFMPLFRALAKGQKRLLLVDKTYLSLNQPIFEPLRELIEEAGTLAEWEVGLRIHRSQTSLWADFEDLADVSEPALAWRHTVAGLEHGEIEPVEPPAGLALPLRPYQLAGFRWLAFLWQHGLGGVLADDMGLGKTAQALALVAHAVEHSGGRVAPQASRIETRASGLDTRPAAQGATRPPEGAPFLVVAPTSVASNWVSEAARFTPGLRVATVTATEARRPGRIVEAAASADLVITTYAVLRLEASAFAALEWGGLVLDEAQFVKNAATKVHQAARDIRAPLRLAVTGTPVENNLSELWALLGIVAPGLFPSRRAFDERYRRPIEEDGNVERLERLRRRIRPLMLRRTKEFVAPELPQKQEQVLRVDLHPRHRRLYDTMLQRERQKLLGLLDDLDRQRFIVYRSLTLLRMLALDATLIDESRYAGYASAKLDALAEQLDDVLAEGHRALVFSQFTSFLGRAADRLDAAGVPFAYLDGTTPARHRDAQIARFRGGEASVFLISLKAGGFGLNLTEADYVFLLDPWWNPASEDQAVDRAHRIGQTKQVMVYRLVAADTIEEKVMALKARKGELVASLLDDDGGALALDEPLGADDLRALLGD
ncbi:DEAD/DEAH box helicase [Agromyces sp. Marseille-P2726]|uniref:DEAD/DEAH box helicase n=1 Tax=Agromyces sp. Marseille-P2726 TaxID=2709132 RepID=UPI001C2D9183|nr:DEAD/DEAH box helicase [Agromyces sp. Marseille-P2726]